MRILALISFFLLCFGVFAQNRKDKNTLDGMWWSDKSFVDSKKSVLTLHRVKHGQFDHGTFLQFQDSTSASLFYSPMCGNDCFWDYDGKYWLKDNKLKVHFETYNQHGTCKAQAKKYGENEMLFSFTVDLSKKDTLVLTRTIK
jgi:hypothetical protein